MSIYRSVMQVDVFYHQPSMQGGLGGYPPRLTMVQSIMVAC